MRLLLDSRPRIPARDLLSDSDLESLYEWPAGGGVRVNFVSTLDGAATGADGVSGSINTTADGRVFHLQRRLADCVLVGAGTARTEGYRRGPTPIVAVSRGGHLPPSLTTGEGRAILVTCAASGQEPSDDVWIAGEDDVDLPAIVARLAAEGMPRILSEGGPTFFHSLLAAGVADEVALTLAPQFVGGEGPRIVSGAPFGAGGIPAELVHLLEEDGSLLSLWTIPSACA